MATSSIAALVAGLALGLIGLALVRQSWIRRQGSHRYLMIAGWALMLVSAWPFVIALGADLGVTTAFIAPMLGAMGVMTQGLAQPLALTAAKPVTAPDTEAPRWFSSLRTLAVTGLAVPVSLIVTLVACVALFRLSLAAGWSMPDSLFAVLLFAPLGWAGLAVISTLAAPLRWRTLTLVALALGFGALALVLSPPTL